MPLISTLAGGSARGLGGMRTFGGAWNTAIEYLVVAGGGGGGSFAGGGGGAGGYKTASEFSLELNTSYTVTVGAGGAGGSYTQGTNGVNSVFATITSTGGGGGGGGEFNKTGNAGGSGGGASASYNNGSGTGGAASPSGQGNNGGSTSGGTPSLAYGAAGGGGAGAVGGSANSNMAGGAGGNGLSSSISGTSVTRAAGGGGGSDPINGGAGGTGGGGNGGTTSASAGTVNTGSGGGGVWNPSYTAGAGGSGVVIARYPGTTQRAYGGTVTSSGGNTIHTFNSSSTFYTGLTLPVSGASLWLDASDDATFTYSSGTVVSQWNDKSGNGRNFAQATVANQPTRNTNIQNGYAGVIGTTNDVLSTSYNWVNSAFTVFLVVKPSSTSGFMGWMGAHTGTGCPALGTANGTGEYSLFRTGISTNPSNLVATLSNADVAVWKSSGVSSGNVSATIYKNGTQSSTNPGYSSSGTGTIATLFASSTGLDDPCTGYLFEVLVYPSELSDTDRNKVEGYLRAKWGTP